MNIETWAYIRHLFLVEKLPKKAIARKLGLDPKTVRNALKKENFSLSRAQKGASKLDSFKPKIEELLKAYPTLSAVRIYEELKRLDYAGGIGILRNYLRSIGKSPKAYLTIHTLPGEEAQVDWGYAGVIAHKRVYCFLMVLSFSRMLYLHFFPSQSMEYFITGHIRAFNFFWGVPKRIRYDNLKSVVLSRLGAAIQFNPRFLDFSSHYLFDPVACNPKSPHEKGRVEIGIRYVKRNFLVGRSFSSLAACNNQAALWRDHSANCRIHGTTKKRPLDLFEQEKPLLIPLPQTSYDARLVRGVKSTSQCLVRFETNSYSVPFAYARCQLTLKADDSLVSIYEKDRLIAQHTRCYQKHKLIEDPHHYKGLLASRPHAIYFRQRDTFFALGQTARLYFEEMAKTTLNPPHQLKKITSLIELYGKTEVLSAIEHALNYQAFGHEYLSNIILQNRRKRSLPESTGPPCSKVNPELIRSTFVEERDLVIYDNHFKEKDTDHEDRES